MKLFACEENMDQNWLSNHSGVHTGEQEWRKE
jgi:hypothetical protein